MALSTQPYKGARDFYPEDKRLQKYMFKTIRKVVEKYGYEEYDAPILEPTELYTSKTSDEIVNEQTYTFTDRGGRGVTIRTEMTPSVSRMVAGRRQELAYPLRWYCTPNMWRYERPQRGRLREFWQPNIDIFGAQGIEADHEIIAVADAIMKAFGAELDMYTIRVNSRALIDAMLLEHLKLNATQAHTVMQLIDRREKMDHAKFVGLVDAVFHPEQRERGDADILFDFLHVNNLSALPDYIKNHKSAEDLRELFVMLEASGIKNAVFDASLMRGFEYYTGVVFEVFDNHPDNNRAMYGGGRYDGLVEAFGVDPLPAVGFAMGDVSLQNFLESHKLLPDPKPETDLYVVLIGDIYKDVQPVLGQLRSLGLKTAVDVSRRKTDKQIKTAVKKGITYAMFIGEKELSDNHFVLKNLSTGKDERHGVERIVSIVKDHRTKKRSV